jgi:mannose-6-phosphate isomerase class I
MLWQRKHNSFGKTEMWYIMQADQDARIIVGFKEDSNADEYLENLKRQNFTFYLGQCKCKREMHFSRNRDGTRYRSRVIGCRNSANF